LLLQLRSRLRSLQRTINKTFSRNKGKPEKGRRGEHTDFRSKIRCGLHLDIQIPIHLSDNLYRVADG
jgi:hypothetical protein